MWTCFCSKKRANDVKVFCQARLLLHQPGLANRLGPAPLPWLILVSLLQQTVASTQAQGPRQLQWARMPKERSVGPFYVLWRKSVDLSIFTCVQWDRSVEETCFVKILQWDRSMEIFFFLKFSKTLLSQENPNGNAPKVCGLMFFHYSIRVHSHCPFSPF